MQVDINCDMGEGYGRWSLGDDPGMMEIITSANVACGFHGGDPNTMVETARLAKEKGVSVGAHPGFNDLWGFGRRVIRGDTMTEIETMIAYQIGAMQACASLAGHTVTHVKAHGALGNLVNDEEDFALALGRAIKAVDASLIYVTMPGLVSERAAERFGLATAAEVFADRAYEDDGQLVSRKKPGSVLHDSDEAARRVLAMVRDQEITTASGKRIPARIDTICVHGDGGTAVTMARRVRDVLEADGVQIKPFGRG
ncbi:LamB/YcsF family protein [uncultured Enterovirga sp.]|uniref:LamB/YcsF family protein n=1 Tax=uncultured Enterovirga sp. TaxID=2026352 RepID=UPI0035CB6C93